MSILSERIIPVHSKICCMCANARTIREQRDGYSTYRTFCFLDVPQDEIELIVDEVEEKGYISFDYSRFLIKVMELKGDKAKLSSSPRLMGDMQTCQFFRYISDRWEKK